MWTEVKIYLACFVSLIALDLLWIGVVMNRFYVEKMRPIGRISGDKFEIVMWAAAAVYVVLSIAIVQFALPRISTETTWLQTFLIGALLGFLIYATYDFTNVATLKHWPLALAFTDMVWGGVLGGIVTLLARYVRDL